MHKKEAAYKTLRVFLCLVFVLVCPSGAADRSNNHTESEEKEEVKADALPLPDAVER